MGGTAGQEPGRGASQCRILLPPMQLRPPRIFPFPGSFHRSCYLLPHPYCPRPCSCPLPWLLSHPMPLSPDLIHAHAPHREWEGQEHGRGQPDSAGSCFPHATAPSKDLPFSRLMSSFMLLPHPCPCQAVLSRAHAPSHSPALSQAHVPFHACS